MRVRMVILFIAKLQTNPRKYNTHCRILETTKDAMSSDNSYDSADFDSYDSYDRNNDNYDRNNEDTVDAATTQVGKEPSVGSQKQDKLHIASTPPTTNTSDTKKTMATPEIFAMKNRYDVPSSSFDAENREQTALIVSRD